MPEYELKYLIKVEKDQEDEAIEFVNAFLRAAFRDLKEIVDWDGPL